MRPTVQLAMVRDRCPAGDGVIELGVVVPAYLGDRYETWHWACALEEIRQHEGDGAVYVRLLEETLRWYADPKNWDLIAKNTSKALMDKGGRARHALGLSELKNRTTVEPVSQAVRCPECHSDTFHSHDCSRGCGTRVDLTDTRPTPVCDWPGRPRRNPARTGS